MNWETKKLDELGFVSRGRSRHRPRDEQSLYGGIYPFIQTGDIKHSGLYITSHTQTYNEKGLAQSKLWPSGTLCITIAANIADTAILSYDSCFPDSVIGFIPDQEKADVRFIKYYFDIVQAKYKQISQGAAQDNLSQQKLLSLPILAPSLPTQKRIAEILSNYDDLIENNNRRISLLEKAVHLLYREWFVRLRFPGYEEVAIVDGVPEGWERVAIKNLGIVVTGKTPSKKIEDNFGDKKLFIKTPDMHNNIFILDTKEKLSDVGHLSQINKAIPPFSIMTSCIGTVGIVSLTAEESHTNQQINTFIPNRNTVRYYVYFFLKNFKDQLEALSSKLLCI